MMRFVRRIGLLIFSAVIASSVALVGLHAAPNDATKSSGPQRIETIIYDQWQVTCRDVVGGKNQRTCSARYQLNDQKSKRAVFVWLMGYDAKGTMTSEFVTPLGVQLLRGLELKLGPAQTRKVSFITCTGRGCRAVTPMSAILLKEGISAPQAQATFYAMNGRPFRFTVNMKGFEKVVQALQRR